MKKIIVMIFLGVAMFGATPVSHAASLSTESKSSANLEAKIAELQKQLAKLQGLKNLSTASARIEDGALWLRLKSEPTTLKVNENGVWKLRALRLDPLAPHSLHIRWGQKNEIEIMKLTPAGNSSQLLSLKHSYTKPGTYDVEFLVVQGDQTSGAQTTIVVGK